VPEGKWQSTYYLEAKGLPKGHGTLVGADDEIKLHCAEAARPGVLQRVLAHAPRYTSATRCRMSYVTAICHMVATVRLVGAKIIGSENALVLHGDESLVV
jgi:hypothetical protein